MIASPRLASFACALLLSTHVSTAAAQPFRAELKLGLSVDASLPHVAGHVLVKLRSGADPALLPLGSQPIFHRWYQVPVAPGDTAAAALRKIALEEWVELVELDAISSLPRQPAGAAAPTQTPVPDKAVSWTNDPLADFQDNFEMVGVPQAWSVTLGQGVVVAVIDSGILRGPDLACRAFVHEYDAIGNVAGPGSALDQNGHGTHVAGTIAQCTNNQVGAAGVAPGVTLMPIRVFDGAGNTTALALARGLLWAAGHGADVVNLSLSWTVSSLEADALDELAARDVVVVAASGNNGQPAVTFPAFYDTVIAVGSVGFDGHRTGYSQYGTDLDIVAPGGDVRADRNNDSVFDGIVQETLPIAGSFCPPVGNSTVCFLQGTSMATPHVAGAAALLRAHQPGANREQVQAALLAGAIDLGEPGFDRQYGAGLLNIPAALQALDIFVDSGFTPCLPDSTTLCLLAGRFRVNVYWRDFVGQVGAGRPLPLTRDSGYFWFFGPDNVEVVVKVLDACGFNQRFWVFAGGLTNVEVVVEVEDLLTGQVRRYQNALGQEFVPKFDTSAFATCG